LKVTELLTNTSVVTPTSFGMEAACHHSTKNRWQINRKSPLNFLAKKGLNAGSITNGSILSNLPMSNWG